MTGGMLQIAAYGAQDVYLTSNPQITFFKIVYRRHTNFAIESIEQQFNSSNSIDFGRKAYSTIERRGDLITNAVLEIKLPALDQTQDGSSYVNWVNGIGNALIKETFVKIGGYTVDKYTNEWLDISSQFSVPTDKKDAYDEMVGNRYVDASLKSMSNVARTFYVPLKYWFNNPGLALPMIALMHHDVELHLELSDLADMIKSDVALSAPVDTSNATASITSCKLYVDYIYLDVDERRRFAQISHEYLIEQVQEMNSENIPAATTSKKVDIYFNQPVKMIQWVISNDTYTTTGSTNDNNKPFLYEASNSIELKDTFSTAKLLMNGVDRFSERNAAYFRLVQPYQYYRKCPAKHIYSYTFALKPDEHQPSGTCNFSMLDNVKMSMTFDATNHTASAGKIKFYAVSYNVLRIMNGMAGIVYA